MYYQNYLHPPITARVNKNGITRVVRFMDTSTCPLHRYETFSKKFF